MNQTITQEEIYKEYRDKVYAYMIHRVRTSEDAEDLVNDVFVKVFDKLGSFDESKAKLSTWIYQITKHTVIDYYRRFHMSEELPEEIESDDAIDEGLLTDETLKELAQGLKRLPDEQREIIIRRYYREQSLLEIASEMSLSYGIVKLRHREALGKLQRYLNRPSPFMVVK